MSLTACLEKGQTAEQRGNFELQLLFEKDGCKMYRFIDGGHAVYWLDCTDKTTYGYKSGKNNYHTLQTLTN